jgi:hypothetical protein
MKATISEKKKRLIKQFHTACTKTGMRPGDKKVIYDSLGIESSTELSEAQLEEVIKSLGTDSDKWRKRVIAAIFGWCKDINLHNYDVVKVKAIACRAAGYKTFNQIPVSRLRDVYYEFVRKSRTTVGARTFKEEMINYLENRN